jgi:hypothetical protein
MNERVWKSAEANEVPSDDGCRFQLNRGLSHFRVRFFQVNRRLTQYLRWSVNCFSGVFEVRRDKKFRYRVGEFSSTER